jgi:hypothetical protein
LERVVAITRCAQTADEKREDIDSAITEAGYPNISFDGQVWERSVSIKVTRPWGKKKAVRAQAIEWFKERYQKTLTDHSMQECWDEYLRAIQDTKTQK